MKGWTVKHITKKFAERVAKEGTVDTAKYRYHFENTFTGAFIKRIPIEYLDTTKAYTGWEKVAEYRR